jgi:hypothetical protein
MAPVVEREETRVVAAAAGGSDGAGPEAGVIDAARRRQRRRRTGVAAVLAIAGVGALIVARGDDGRAPAQRPAAPRAVAVAPGTVVARTYMGVSCHRANWIGCDRVGLAVWLKRPARTVTGTIAGRPLRLGDKQWSVPSRRMYAGFLQPAGMRDRLHVRPDAQGYWDGAPTPAPVVTLRIVSADGRAVTTRLRVPLMAGWG